MPLMPRKFQDYRILPFTASPLDPILNEIDRLFGFGFYYAAVALALSLPDVCSSLEVESGDTQKRFKADKRYKPWCQKYLQPKFSIFDAEDCWALRGGVLHNGKLHGHPSSKYTRVIFLPPQGYVHHELVSRNNGESDESALILDVKEFCHQMIAAVQEWYATAKENPVVRANIEGLVRTRPNGMAPHYVGVPVIA